MDTKQKSSDSPIILQRVQMLGEELLPPEIWDRFIQTPQEKMIFLTVADPNQWPVSMRPLQQWIEENVPPEYWAEFEED